MEPTTEKTSLSDHDPEKTTYPEKIEEGHTTDGAYNHDGEDGREVSLQGGVHRNLKQRHISMIAIGGTIGTGLFVGSGAALANGGPLGMLLGYTIMGSIVYSMMVALGEMVTLYPITGSFTHYAGRFADPALGFAVGWNYWYSYAITLPTEITAAGIVVQYWDQSTPIAVYITVFLVTICAINFFGVRWYGEAEFWFSAVKVVTIVGLIILGLILGLGGGPDTDARFGFVFWKNPGAFNQLNGINGSEGRFLAFWATLVQAAFSFLGTEIVALTAGETSNPRRAMPKAIRRVFYRILLFYVGGVLVIGWLVAYDNPDLIGNASNAASSPFVIGIKSAGINVLPSIINAAILVSAYSAGNSDLYASSRTLYGLAMDGKAPAFFRYTTKGGIPVFCLIATALFGPLAYLNVSNGSSQVFTWLSALSATTGMLTWMAIFISYLRFYAGLKYHGIDRSGFAFTAPLQPYLSWWGLIVITIIILTQGFPVFLSGSWKASTFVADYVTLPIFALLYVFWKVLKRTKSVPLSSMDFDTGRRQLDDMAEEEEANYVAPTTFAGKVWDWLF